MSAASISSAAIIDAMAAFVREVCAIRTPIADTGPGDAFTGTALEFVAPASRRRRCANFRCGVTSLKVFIHAVAAIVITVAKPALQNAALCSRAEELRGTAYGCRAVALVPAGVTVNVAVTHVVGVDALAVATVYHASGTLCSVDFCKITANFVGGILAVIIVIAAKPLVHALPISAVEIVLEAGGRFSAVFFVR